MRTFSAAAFLLLCAAGTTVLDASAQSRLGTAPAKRVAPSFKAGTLPSAARGGGGYCTAGAEGSVDFGLDERIVNVSFANINNASADEAPVLPAYTYYASPVGNVTIGQTYTLDVDVNTTTLTTGWSETQVLAWIDFNADFDFDDAGEQVMVSVIDALDIYSASVTIPSGAAVGVTRMRVRMHDTHDGSQYINVFNDTPCGVASYGEVEDYTINITGGGSGSSNDDCADVSPVSLNVNGTVVFTGDNSTAVPGGDGVLDVGGDTTTVWHIFTTTECSNVTLSYCGTAVAPAVSWAYLFTSCPADNNFIAFSDYSFTACGDDNLTLYFYDLPAGTYYVPVRGEPATAGPYTVTLEAAPCATSGAYCTASATNTNATLEKISNVTVSDINNSSTSAVGYEDFTGVTGNMSAGQSYPVTVTLANGWDTDEVRIWIDFDQSDSFESGELVFVSDIGPGPYTGTISVPGGAAVGTTRMRVRLHDTYDLNIDYTNVPNPDPCGTSTFGQVEDYTINISGGGPTPTNDLCGNVNAVSLSVGNTITFTGDNTNATSTGDFVPGSVFDPMDPTVWHSFTTTECSNVVVSYCNTDPAFGNIWIFLSPSCPAGDNYVLGAAEFTSCPDNGTVSYFNLPAGTWYLPVLMDPAAAVGPYSIDVTATACASPGNYCEASAVSLSFEKISNVTFADINNNSTSAAGFEDFTSQTASVIGGVSYPISVTIAAGYDTDQVLAWIDWDHSSTFDGNELVLASTLGVGPHTGNVTVPLTAVAGPTRMRVRLHDTYDLGVDYFNTPNATPCDTSTFGQVEDYTVDMIGIITGVNTLSNGAWSVFPNPNNGDFVVRYAGRDGRATIEVLDMTGRTVHVEQRAVAAGSTVQLSLAGRIAKGTYALRITTAEGSEERRIVVQ